MKKTNFIAIAILLASLYSSCSDENYTPKPKGYPRIVLPEKKYQKYSGLQPFTFEYPEYATVQVDSANATRNEVNPNFINIYFKTLNARLHLSYKQITKNTSFDQLMEDAYFLTFKHSIKAEAIDRVNLYVKPGVGGQMFVVSGNAASANQFYLTDSTQHYIRGALYFYCPPNADSLLPVQRFIQKDIDHFIQTFDWKK